jgi:hypothetical protein
MLIALTNSPELAAHPPPIRQLLVQRALALLHSDCKWASWIQVIFPLVGGLLGVVAGLFVGILFFPAKTAAEAIPTAMYCNSLGVAIGGFAGGFVGLQLQARQLRPYLCEVIEDYNREANQRL